MSNLKLTFFFSFLLIFLIKTTLTNETSNVNEKEKLNIFKNETGAGHYYEHSNQQNYGQSYNPPYNSYSQQYPTYNYPKPLHLVDDYLCDLDASILIVSNNKKLPSMLRDSPPASAPRNGYGIPPIQKNPTMFQSSFLFPQNGMSSFMMRDSNIDPSMRMFQNFAEAHRLRCSDIAITDDKNCATCCQLGARRDRSIAKDRIIGFLVDNLQISEKKNQKQFKRSTSLKSSTAKTIEESNDLNSTTPTEFKCVCCAPKYRFKEESVPQYGYKKPNYGSPYNHQQSVFQYGPMHPSASSHST